MWSHPTPSSNRSSTSPALRVEAAPRQVPKVRSPVGEMSVQATPVCNGDLSRRTWAPCLRYDSASRAASSSAPTLPTNRQSAPRAARALTVFPALPPADLLGFKGCISRANASRRASSISCMPPGGKPASRSKLSSSNCTKTSTNALPIPAIFTLCAYFSAKILHIYKKTPTFAPHLRHKLHSATFTASVAQLVRAHDC